MSKVIYTPLGGVGGATYGNGTAEAINYDNRGWMVGDIVSGFAANGTPTTLYCFNVTNYAPDGDMLAVTENVNGNWGYTYDGFNRIATATMNRNPILGNSGCSVGTNPGSSGAQAWSYDRYGNRWTQTTTSGNILWPQPQLSFTGSANRVDQYGYDAAGNLTFDGTHHYTYDDESRIVAVDNGGTGQYVYDADGLRIHRVGSEGPEDYAYDQMGHAVTTYASPAGSYLRVELYGGSLHVATYANATTYFNHSDWTGTERVRSAMDGTSSETCSSLPYGDAQSCQGYEAGPVHFTGKPRDPETGLNVFQARYYASMSGRWMLPDWSALPDWCPTRPSATGRR